MLLHDLKNIIEEIDSKSPKILCLTSMLSMKVVSDILLSIGAKPFISYDRSEIEELIIASDSLYIDIGTLDHNFVQLIMTALSLAKKHRKPIVLAPTKAGKSNIRTLTSFNILPYVDVIKGSMNEIIALCKVSENRDNSKDLSNDSNIVNKIKKLAKKYSCIVVATDTNDFITDGTRESIIEYGNPIFTKVTTLSSGLGAMIAASIAISKDYYYATTIITSYFNICGEIVASLSRGPASFNLHFIDTLYSKHFDLISEYINLKEHKID